MTIRKQHNTTNLQTPTRSSETTHNNQGLARAYRQNAENFKSAEEQLLASKEEVNLIKTDAESTSQLDQPLGNDHLHSSESSKIVGDVGNSSEEGTFSLDE
ncbi:MAG: hypothetical protein EKK61_04930 [Rickettsiales bacterium]|nr:MAG: hypothetical protein EKK61_04930 [Rickettsiales bacterium]